MSAITYRNGASLARCDVPTPLVRSCKKCGGVSKRVATLPKSQENGAYEVFQCLDCKFAEWQEIARE
jgi:hypothetical protein